MKVKLYRTQWIELGLDEGSNYRIALACFYLGFGFEETRRLVKLGLDHPDVKDAMDIAVFSGLDPSKDSITSA